MNEFSPGGSPKNKLAGLLPLAFLAVAGLAFFGGLEVQKDLLTKAVAASTTSAQNTGGTGGRGFGNAGTTSGRRFGSRPTLGTVSSISNSTLVIKTSSANVTVTLTSTTQIIDSSGTAANTSDIGVGETIAVFGIAASDGSITATRVLINPSFGSGSGTGTGSSSSSSGI